MLYLTRKQVAEACGVTEKTVYRWQTGQQQAPKSARDLINILEGHCPWPGWERFHFTNAGILAPGAADAVSPNDVAKIALMKQELDALKRRARGPAQYLLDF